MTNNKQQTAMKLYTEEQVLQIIGNLNREYFVTPEELLEEMKYTSIELPSDEEIKKMMELDGMEFDEFDPYDVSYLGGACWMRNKIQGGEQ
jgi:hypothetical protein